MKILVTGLSGFVGQHLASRLFAQGHEVVGLTRNPNRAAQNSDDKIKWFKWDPLNELPPRESFEGVESIINLLGESIAAKRWSDSQKEAILKTRVDATKNLIDGINQFGEDVKSLVSASAVGIYPKNLSDELNENSELDNDFLAHVCQKWEAATEGLKTDTRKAIIRIGVVLGKEGGALSKLLPIFKLGGGGPIGNGKISMPWIHVKDLASLFSEAATNQKFQGIYNAVAPENATNLEFTKALAKSINRPAFLPVPPFMLKLLFGEMSTIVLDGQKIKPKKALEDGFQFQFSRIDEAMNNINE